MAKANPRPLRPFFLNRSDLRRALLAIETQGEVIEEALLISVLEDHHKYRMQNIVFGEAIRFALNDAGLANPRRKLYASAIGYYFNPRALAAKEKGIVQPPVESPTLYQVERSGQLRFVI